MNCFGIGDAEAGCFGICSVVLLILWLLLFVVLSDYNCPLFYTRYACQGRCGHN